MFLVELFFKLFERYPQFVTIFVHLLFCVRLFISPFRQESLDVVSRIFAYLHRSVITIFFIDILKCLLEVLGPLEELIGLGLSLLQLLVQLLLEGRHHWLLRTLFFLDFGLLCGDARKHTVFELSLMLLILLLLQNLVQLFLLPFLVLDGQLPQMLLRFVEHGLDVRLSGGSIRVPNRAPQVFELDLVTLRAHTAAVRV